MAAVPTPRLAFSAALAVPLRRPGVCLTVSAVAPRALPPLLRARALSSSAKPVSYTVSAVSATAGNSGNGVAVSDFDEAPVLDTDPLLSPLSVSGISDDNLGLSSDVEDDLLINEVLPSVEEDAPKVPDVPPPDDQGRPHLASFRLSDVTLKQLAANGITHATEVQAGTFDLVYDNRDVIAKSRTGTGKTLAFALPIMERLAEISRSQGRVRRGGGPRCIVLAPTRELAKQVSREMAYLGQGLNLSVECFYGGSAYGPQENALKRGLDVLVGTPGRVMDHMNRGNLRLDDVSFAVLDEADEMLSMGFAQDVETVFETLPPPESRQVILFSATVPSWVKSLASQYQRPDVVIFDAVTSGSAASITVTHCAVRVPEREEARAGLLADIIAVHSNIRSEDGGENSPQMSGPSRAIVFTETKREADELATSGALDGCGAAVLHGDVSQRQREVTLAQFRQGKFQVLVATDVAARGLDISGVDVVVQYRVPQDSESYIHRAGRTGRAGRSGTAVVMYSDREMGRLKTVERDCRIKFKQEAAPAPELALEAAVDVALCNLGNVDERVRKHLMGKAAKLLEDEEARVETIASLLAMAGRRTRLEDRSVLSGENGKRTLIVRRGDGQEVSTGMALRLISEIGRRLENEGIIKDRVDVGLIRPCRDGSTVLDVPSGLADALLEEWSRLITEREDDEAELMVELAVKVPALKDERRSESRGRYGDRRGGGRFNDRGGERRFGGGRDRRRGGWGGDRHERNNNYSRGGGYSRGDRDFGRGDRGDRGDYGRGRNERGDSGRRGRRGDWGDGGGRRAPQQLSDDF